MERPTVKSVARALHPKRMGLRTLMRVVEQLGLAEGGAGFTPEVSAAMQTFCWEAGAERVILIPGRGHVVVNGGKPTLFFDLKDNRFYVGTWEEITAPKREET